MSSPPGPSSSSLSTFHHVNFKVSNAMQAAYWYCTCLGFKRHAELKNDKSTSIVVKNEEVIFVFNSTIDNSAENVRYITTHGDCVQDVAFTVNDLKQMLKELRNNGASLLKDITVSSDEFGSIRQAKIQAKDGDLQHTLIEYIDYVGPFLPGYKMVASTSNGPINSLPSLQLLKIDHVVHNYPKHKLKDVAQWYHDTLKLTRFWSVDDSVCSSEFSAMKAWLVTNSNQTVQMTITEPVEDTRKGRSQIQEYLDYNGGPGIQHVALLVNNIIEVVSEMRLRSIEFLTVPFSYYVDLEERLAKSNVKVAEDIGKLRQLSILLDFDEDGYLLQIFTKPVQDRPTLFIEIIQRNNFNGFGAGNFKALFDAIEREQANRGTLQKDD